MRIRHEPNSLMAPGVADMSLDDQQRECRQLLHRLGARALDASAVRAASDPFEWHLVVRRQVPLTVTLNGGQGGGGDGEQARAEAQLIQQMYARRGLNVPAEQMSAVQLHATVEENQCMCNKRREKRTRQQGYGWYLRIALAGRRSAMPGPVMEAAHRVICWLAHGPPPNPPQPNDEPAEPPVPEPFAPGTPQHGQPEHQHPQQQPPRSTFLGLPLHARAAPTDRWDPRWRVVGHRCGDSRCLAPSHLAWMSPEENNACRQWHAAHGTGPSRLWPPPEQ